MFSEKTVASLLAVMLGKTTPAESPKPVDPPAVERAAPAIPVRTSIERDDLETDFGNLRGSQALARSRELRGKTAKKKTPKRKLSAAAARRNARLNAHYRRLEAERPRND